MKKAFSVLCIPALLCCLVLLTAAAPSRTYVSGRFTDLSASQEAAVKTVYEYAVMDGTDRTRFSPNGELTYAQALVIACRLHGCAYGLDTSFRGGDPWYQPYIAYASEHGITETAYPYERPIPRSEFAVLLDAAFPALPEINQVEDGAIPDVAREFDYAAPIYRLYRAGVLTGSNAAGAFAPNRSITRWEAAAIAARMLDASQRRHVTLTREAALAYTEARLYQVLTEGIENRAGWTYVEGGATTDRIDLTSFGFSDEKGSEGREILRRVYQRVFFDHPQLFYLREGYWRTHSGDRLTGIIPMYHDLPKEELASYEAVFQTAVEKALAQVEGVTDPVEQLLILHDYLVRENLYNWGIAADPDRQDPWWARSAYGALTGDCVCKGYALAYRVLLDRLGFRSAIAVNGEGTHVWNVVELDGAWYHIDVNWDNNPFPNVKGRCRHDYFLISDKTLQSLEGSHADWTAFGNGCENIACVSTKYETADWAFRRQADFSLYRRDGGYFYLAGKGSSAFTLYHGGLSGDGKAVTELSVAHRSGVVWLEDSLFYVDTRQRLVRYDLSGGGQTVLGNISFTPAASPDKLCGQSRDGIGLQYDAETEELAAFASTRRTELARFPLSP